MQSSIDSTELAKFNYDAHQWWNVNGKFKILHKINSIRLKFVLDKISMHYSFTGNKSFDGIKLLDIGCGGGLMSVPLYKAGIDVTGIDASVKNIEAAKAYAVSCNLYINYLNTTVEEHIGNKLQYDIVLCLEVIEHVANVQNFVKNLAALIKPHGMLILSTMNRNLKSYLLAIIMAEYVLRFVPKNTHDHSKFIKPIELEHMLLAYNMYIHEFKGMVLNPLTFKWKLSDNIDVNYFVYAVKAS